MPPWTSPATYYSSPQPDIYRSTLKFMVHSHSLWKYRQTLKAPMWLWFLYFLELLVQPWDSSPYTYTVQHNAYMQTGRIKTILGGWRQVMWTHQQLNFHMATIPAQTEYVKYLTCNTKTELVKIHISLKRRQWVRERKKRKESNEEHPSLGKQRGQAIFISQLHLYGDLGWGWNLLYRNLASVDQKTVGIFLSKRQSSHNDIRHLWRMRSSGQGKMSNWFESSQRRYWVGIEGHNHLLTSQGQKIDLICGSQTYSAAQASHVFA